MCLYKAKWNYSQNCCYPALHEVKESECNINESSSQPTSKQTPANNLKQTLEDTSDRVSKALTRFTDAFAPTKNTIA